MAWTPDGGLVTERFPPTPPNLVTRRMDTRFPVGLARSAQ